MVKHNQEDSIMKIQLSAEKEIFSVVFGGDVCPGTDGAAVMDAGKGAEVMRGVKGFVESADVRIVQWETPLTDHPAPILKSGPNLNSRTDTLEIVKSAGFNVALLANNHTGDHGAAAVLETLEKIHRAGLQTVGAGRNLEEADKPLILDVKGKKLAVFNWAENEFGCAGRHTPGAAPQRVIPDLAAVRAAADRYDAVIVTLHGGHEHNPFPSPRMVELCRAFADAGAKMVFNCHTHCPEAVENYHGVPIVYCPGNFYFPHAYSENFWFTGYLVRCGFGENGACSLELLAYTFDNEKVTPLDADGQARFEEYMKKLAAPLNDPKKLQSLFEAWSTQSGKGYYCSVMSTTPDTSWINQITDPEVRKRVMPLRNIFTCESHNDMLKCWLRLAEEQRFEKAAAGFAEIQELQKGF